MPPGRRYGTDVEAAVYFCCLEAVNNARKHAPGAAITITFAEVDGVLRFSVRDDGPGFAIDPSAAGHQRGMRNVATRITAVGGTVALDSAPGRGTTVAGSIPLADATPGTTTDPDPATGPITLPAPVPGDVEDALAPETPDAARESSFLDTVRDLLDGLEVPPPAAPRMREIVAELHAPPASDAPRLPAPLRARRALDGLEALARRGTGGRDWSWQVLYAVERARLAGARELAEGELADALRRGAVVLPAGEQAAAERLTGGAGTSAAARLGLADDAGPEDLRRAAQEQIATWKARAGHPASSRAVREAALVLAGVCEAVLADTAPARARD